MSQATAEYNAAWSPSPGRGPPGQRFGSAAPNPHSFLECSLQAHEHPTAIVELYQPGEHRGIVRDSRVGGHASWRKVGHPRQKRCAPHAAHVKVQTDTTLRQLYGRV